MVVRTRLRSVLLPLALYAVSGGCVAYFVWHASNGERGLKAKAGYEVAIARLEGELAQARAERRRWEARVALMRSDGLDRDLLDEEARLVLDRVDRRDLVVFLSPRP